MFCPYHSSIFPLKFTSIVMKFRITTCCVKFIFSASKEQNQNLAKPALELPSKILNTQQIIFKYD